MRRKTMAVAAEYVLRSQPVSGIRLVKIWATRKVLNNAEGASDPPGRFLKILGDFSVSNPSG